VVFPGLFLQPLAVVANPCGFVNGLNPPSRADFIFLRLSPFIRTHVILNAIASIRENLLCNVKMSSIRH